MVIAVLEMADADFVRGFEILSDSFAHNHEQIDTVFPNHDTPRGRETGAKRLLETKQTQPYTHFVKAMDPEGHMIGMARWDLFKDEIPPEDGIGTQEYWEDTATAEYADAVFRRYLEPRRKAIRESGGNLACLDLLTVDPKHFRRGAGRALIRWGLQKANEMGIDAVVEASKLGVPAYTAEGFRGIRVVTVEVPEAPKFANRRREVYTWMTWERKRSAES